MVLQGATALFVASNNGLPPDRADVANEARKVDIARAIERRVWVIRADVAGRTADLVCSESSAIVDPEGIVVQSGQPFSEDLLVADLDPLARAGRPALVAQSLQESQ